jgi:hypothetical protein
VADTQDPVALWEAVNDELHRGELIPGLWEAASAVKALAIEGDTLVLGVPLDKAGLASHLESTRHRIHVQNIVEKVAGRKLECRVIEGDTPEAWEKRKALEQARAAAADDALERRRQRKDAIGSWEGLRETLTVNYGQLASRRSPKALAEYLEAVLPLVREVETKLQEQGLADDHAHERSLSRVFDKIATQCGIPSTIVALEYIRLGRAE